jgi:hypothetical protein
MTYRRIFQSLLFVEIGLLLLVTTLVYLPNLRKATIYRDDWYYTVDRMIGGPQTFHSMFNIDRPARGYFFEAYYRLFGVEPAPYHMAAFAWRLLEGLAAFWLFTLIWPKQRGAALLIALLFLIYPGYTRWMEGMEDQPKIVSMTLMVISFALTILAIRSARLLPRIALWAGAILTGWGYMMLVDYAMGMEVFRFLIIFVLANRAQPVRIGQPFRLWRTRTLAVIRAGAPGALALGGFLFWRVILFHNERPETDIKLQLSKVAGSPLAGLANWLIHLVQSSANEAVVAWGGYGIQDFFKLNTAQVFIGLFTALLVAAAVVFALARLDKQRPVQEEGAEVTPAGIPWQREAVWMGLVGVIAGVLPVVLANRIGLFGIESHYLMPASLAAATLLGGVIYSIASSSLRLSAIAVVVLLAVVTQYTFSTKVANEEQILGNFWHQVAWRAPGIREGTSLLVNYPSVIIGEDVDYVHGPANFIYYPQPVNEEFPLRYKLFALKQYPWTVKEFQAGGKVRDGYRTHYGIIDYGYVLVITQPTVDSCVHIVDRQWPWFSFDDLDTVLAVGQNSNIRNVRTNVTPPSLSETIFGPEPAHGWCYSFEKAELALENKDWQAIATLGNEVSSLKLLPNDSLEWMPFLQAYAQLGDEKAFTDTLGKIEITPYNQVQACGVMTKMQQALSPFSPGIQGVIKEKLCKN